MRGKPVYISPVETAGPGGQTGTSHSSPADQLGDHGETEGGHTALQPSQHGPAHVGGRLAGVLTT